MISDIAHFWRYCSKQERPIPVILHKGHTEVVDEGGETDEGFSRSQTTYSFDGEIVTREIEGTSKDCDGRTEFYGIRRCTVDNLFAGDKAGSFEVFYPKWEFLPR